MLSDPNSTLTLGKPGDRMMRLICRNRHKGTWAMSLTALARVLILGTFCIGYGQVANAQSIPPTPLQSPEGLAISPVTGHLWVADYKSNSVIEISGTNPPSLAAQYVVAAHVITTGLNGPTRIAFDATGNLYVANSIGNNVTVYTLNSDGTFTQTNDNLDDEGRIDRPLGIAVDRCTNDVYVANNAGTQPLLFIYKNFKPNSNTRVASYSTQLVHDAPGALALMLARSCAGANDAVQGTLLVANGPTTEPSTIDEYSNLILRNGGSANSALQPTDPSFSPDAANAGPTGIAPGGLNSDMVQAISYYYTDSVKVWGLLSPLTTSNGFLTMSNTTYANVGSRTPFGGCEGVAVDGSQTLYVANSSFHTVASFSLLQLTSGVPKPISWFNSYCLQPAICIP
jgi:hypothetical protein